MLNQSDVGQTLHGAGVQVSNLKVKDIGGVPAVYGSVANADEKRKAESAIEAKFGKIANHLEIQSPIGTAAAPREYTVKGGDTLSKIAKQFYGDPAQWKKIHAANADLIRNPDLIHPGWKLQIP